MVWVLDLTLASLEQRHLDLHQQVPPPSSTLSGFRTGYNFVSFFLCAKMAYLAPMELQTQIEKLEARIAAWRCDIRHDYLQGVASR